MKQFAVIGLGALGKRMIDELARLDAEILIIDHDPDLVEKFKNRVTESYIANALHEEVLQKTIPETIDAAIVDLGGKVEESVLVTNYLKKMGITQIVAHAESDEHGEILQLVGATHVIFPTREAAKRITPLLVSSEIFNYLPISRGLVIAEVKVPPSIEGKTIVEADLRRTHGINVIALRRENKEEFAFVPREYHLQAGDILLLAGNEERLSRFSGISTYTRQYRHNKKGLFKSLFGWK